MEMNQVRYFLAICEHRNFTHAASASNVSQPSLSAAIKKLEAELGGTLFIRDRAGCRLTPLGKLMLPRLNRVYIETREAKAEAVRHTRLERVPISIGIGETIGHNKVSEAVERFRTRLPQAEIELIVTPSETLFSGLRGGDFDIVVTTENVSPDLYRIDPLYRGGVPCCRCDWPRSGEPGRGVSRGPCQYQHAGQTKLRDARYAS